MFKNQTLPAIGRINYAINYLLCSSFLTMIFLFIVIISPRNRFLGILFVFFGVCLDVLRQFCSSQFRLSEEGRYHDLVLKIEDATKRPALYSIFVENYIYFSYIFFILICEAAKGSIIIKLFNRISFVFAYLPDNFYPFIHSADAFGGGRSEVRLHIFLVRNLLELAGFFLLLQ